MAKELGIDRSTYSYYELGKITPSFRTITHLAQLYKVDYTEILDADVQMMCNDFTKNTDSLSDILSYDDSYSQTQEENILIGLKLLSKNSRDEVLNFVLSKVKEERKIKVKRKRRTPGID